MALRTARSTVDQREALIKLRADLQEALDSLPGRFWIVRSQEASYRDVLAHLEAWISWETDV